MKCTALFFLDVYSQLGISFKMFILWTAPLGVRQFTSSNLDAYTTRLVLEYIFHLFLTEKTGNSDVSTSMTQPGIPFNSGSATMDDLPWRQRDGTPVCAHAAHVKFLDTHTVECSTAACHQAHQRMWYCTACWSKAKRVIQVLKRGHCKHENKAEVQHQLARLVQCCRC